MQCRTRHVSKRRSRLRNPLFPDVAEIGPRMLRHRNCNTTVRRHHSSDQGLHLCRQALMPRNRRKEMFHLTLQHLPWRIWKRIDFALLQASYRSGLLRVAA